MFRRRVFASKSEIGRGGWGKFDIEEPQIDMRCHGGDRQ